MNTLHHIVEPARLLMTWQPLDINASSRTRCIIGEVYQESGGQIVFRYLRNTPDFEEACNKGFKGFPAGRRRSAPRRD